MQNREVCHAQKEFVNTVILIVKKMSFTFFHGALFMKWKGQNCTIKYNIKTIISYRCLITTKPGGFYCKKTGISYLL